MAIRRILVAVSADFYPKSRLQGLKMRITKTYIDNIIPPPFRDNGKPDQAFYRDSAMIGFGLRVTSGGTKSFIVEKRINGKVKRLTLGRYGNLTVEQARNEAMHFLGEVASGKNPVAAKRNLRIRNATLLDAFEDYLLSRRDLKASTIHDYRRSINGPFLNWQTKRLTEITKDMVQLRHAALGKKSKARANNAMRVLRAVFNHAISQYEDNYGHQVIINNPVDRLSQTRAWYKIKRRQTVIKPHELPDWFAATLQLKNETTRDYLYFLLLTGIRRSEASTIQWQDIDFTDRTLSIRATRNHQLHSLPLSDFLYELLKKRHMVKASPYVFPSDSERGYLVEPRTAVKRVSELSGVTFTLHDLRRTFISIAESIDIPASALKRLLNHNDPNDETANYIVSNVNRLREPMQQITDFIIKNNNKNTNMC
jgi:integrase